MREFIFRFYRPITLLSVIFILVLGQLTKLYDESTIKPFLTPSIGAVTITLLIWIWKLGRDLEDKIQKAYSEYQAEFKRRQDDIDRQNKRIDQEVLEDINIEEGVPEHLEADLMFVRNQDGYLVDVEPAK